MKCFFTWQPVNDITSCFLLNGIFTLDCEMSVQNWVRWRSADAVAVNDLECRHKCCVMCCGSRRVSPLWVFAYFIPTVGWSNSWAVTCLPLCPRWSNGQFPLTLTGQPNRNFPLITLSFLWFNICLSPLTHSSKTLALPAVHDNAGITRGSTEKASQRHHKVCTCFILLSASSFEYCSESISMV